MNNQTPCRQPDSLLSHAVHSIDMLRLQPHERLDGLGTEHVTVEIDALEGGLALQHGEQVLSCLVAQIIVRQINHLQR